MKRWRGVQVVVLLLLACAAATTHAQEASRKQQKKKRGGINAKTIDKAMELFDMDADGRLSVDELEIGLDDDSMQYQLPKSLLKKFTKWSKNFPALDKDGDGYWSKNEILQGFQTSGKKSKTPADKGRQTQAHPTKAPARAIDKAIALFDNDADGQLSSAELANGIDDASIQKNCPKWIFAGFQRSLSKFAEYDTDGDGEWSRQEIMEAWTASSANHATP